MILSLVILVSAAVVLLAAGFIAGRASVMRRIERYTAQIAVNAAEDAQYAAATAEHDDQADQWPETLASLPKVPAHEPVPWQHHALELVEADAAEMPRAGWQLIDEQTWMPPVETLYGRRAGDALSRLLWEAALMPAGPAALPAPQAALEAPRSTDG